DAKHAQGLDGEIEDRVKHETHEVERVDLGLAFDAPAPDVGNADLVKSQPVDHAADIAVGFRQMGEGVAHAPGDKPKIATMDRQLDIVTHPGDETHGEHGGDHPERRFAGALLADPVNNLIAVLPTGHEFGN